MIGVTIEVFLQVANLLRGLHVDEKINELSESGRGSNKGPCV